MVAAVAVALATCSYGGFGGSIRVPPESFMRWAAIHALASRKAGKKINMRYELGVLAAAMALMGCSQGEDGAAQKPPAESVRTVSAAEVVLRPMGASQEVSGLLVPREEVVVGPELSGYRVAALLADEGDAVRAGQPLARLDDGLLQARIRQAEAALAQARARARQAQAESARVVGLEGQGVLSDEQIQQRRTAAASEQASADVAAAQLAGLRVEAERMTLRAPVAGVVLQRTVRRGDVASPGAEPMFRLAREGLVELSAEVPEHLLGGIRQGEGAAVVLASGTQVQGQVRLLSRRVDEKTKLVQVRVTLPVRQDLRPGGFARASFQPEARPVAAVPEKAVHFEAGGPQLATIDAEGRIRKTPVTLGVRTDGWVELRSGPPVGTLLALGGGAFALEGDKVLVHGVSPMQGPRPAAQRGQSLTLQDGTMQGSPAAGRQETGLRS